MRIALVSDHASPLAVLGGEDAGGQNVHVAALAAALADRGHRIEVYTRRDDPGLPARVRLRPGVEVVHVPVGPAEAVPKDALAGYMPQFGEWLARHWRRRPPDLVHTHFWMSGLAGLAARRSVARPVVHTFHALGAVKRRHQGAADTSPAGRVAAEAGIAAGADAVIATCSDEVRELVGLGAPADRLHVVPCGVDTRLFTPVGAVLPRTPGLQRIVCVGRLVERKGVATAIAALPRLPGVELLVVGGPASADLAADPQAARLAARAAALGVADRVRLLGRVPHDDLPPLLRSADAVVAVPWYEPFGIVPVEAMACGVPVVAAAVGGMLDTVADGVTGVHVPPDDPAALAGALLRLLGDRRRRTAMGRAGARRAVQRYPWRQVAARTEAVYDQVRDGATAPVRGRRRAPVTAPLAGQAAG